MNTVLILTVGGSDAPLVEAIKHYQPDFIFFICSGGTGPQASRKMVDDEGENIISKSGYKSEYKIIEVSDPDSFEEVFQKTKEIIEDAKKLNPREIIADFTGGTKTMSAVLAMLSVLDFDCKPSLTTGPRRDLNRVKGTTYPRICDVQSAQVENVMKTVDELISRYLYFPAEMVLRDLVRRLPLRDELIRKVQRKLDLCECFSLWDRFEYEKAFEILRDYARDYQKQFEYLLKILNKAKNSGYEPVFDLISNAERQAYNGFYDNAVARIYRAVELFAQTRLKKQHNIDTSHLEKFLDSLKNKDKWEKKKDENGVIKIGLTNSYEVLLELEDPVGKIFEKKKSDFLNSLGIRNFSKLAHGDKPIDEHDYSTIYNFFKGFIEECCNAIYVKVEYIDLPKTLL